ncbi:MAG: PAS domain S-box protein [Hydrogenophaga sp.]|uniref:PAS domain-containing sensor histidine kinase n=1 Tax=Hydrogenophaga sp. TaxID=1904254 RepID=UPI001D570C76|nr:PAS domain S-box protein [Hydrogenophaga sp.]MBX3608780.1 PAS domain S-box protein [Hydrogenophaga sp.]
MQSAASEQVTGEAGAIGNEAPCGLLSLDSALRVREINDTLLSWLGRDRAEFDRLANGGFADFPTLARLREESDLEQLREHLRELQTTGRAVPLQLRLWGKDGGYFTVELVSQAVREPGGRFAFSRSALVDISERERIEHQLVARLRLLQAITDRTPSRLAYYDTELVCRFCNAAYAEGYGLQADDVIGLELARVLRPEVLPEVLPRVARVLNGEAISHEAEREGTDGTARYFEVHYVPDQQKDEVPGFFIELIDITERRRTEDFVFNANLDLEERVSQRSAELYESEQRFRLMSDAIRDHAIFFVDPDGGVSDWTESAQRLFGMAYGQIVGRSLDALFQAEDGARTPLDAQLLLDQCFANGQAEHQGWSRRGDGTRFWSHATLTALRNQREELQGISVIVRDLTESKRLADVTAELHRELELRVQQRTAQLDAAHRELDAFSYTVAHDLRAPLRHINQFVSLTQEVLEPEARHELLQYQASIATAARRMSQMIDGLLEFARLGRVQIAPQPVPLTPLMLGIAGRLKAQSEPRVIQWSIDTMLPTVAGDPILLAEVFGKLLDNAVKFTRRVEDARIEIGHLPGTDGNVIVFVRDNGVGFDMERAKTLFLMFQRQHHSMDYEGIGMGLALAQRIVQRHDGRIWCQSAPGEGCTFFVELPRAVTGNTKY